MTPNKPTSSFKNSLEFPEETMEVTLGCIEMNPLYQSRKLMNSKTVELYQRALSNEALFPPLLVARREGDSPMDKLILLDGWHRYQAMRNSDFKGNVVVKALTVPKDTNTATLRFLGARGNLTHGLGLTSSDRRELFKIYVKAGQCRKGLKYKSYREIARELQATSHQTLARWMQQDFPSIARAMSAGNGTNTAAEGTGNRLTTMPDLRGREIKLTLEEVFEAARESSDQERWTIAEQVKALLTRLHQECPGTPPPEDEF